MRGLSANHANPIPVVKRLFLQPAMKPHTPKNPKHVGRTHHDEGNAIAAHLITNSRRRLYAMHFDVQVLAPSLYPTTAQSTISERAMKRKPVSIMPTLVPSEFAPPSESQPC